MKYLEFDVFASICNKNGGKTAGLKLTP